MANPDRVPGKKGVLWRDPERYVPVLEHYLLPYQGPLALKTAISQEAIPPVLPSQTIDRASLVSDWRMYCNGPDPSNPPQIPDGVGDCTIARAAHSFTAMSAYAGHPEPVFGNMEIIRAYSACGGYVLGDENTDNGCAEPDVSQFLVKTGLTDTSGKVHKYVAWAAFGDPSNLPLMAAALNTFGSVTVDIDCPQSAEDQFAQGVPWSYVAGSPIVGGHSIALQKRGSGYIGVEEVVTWGVLQRSTRGFCRHQIREAYIGISEDWIEANGTTIQGLDLAQLLADMPSVE